MSVVIFTVACFVLTYIFLYGVKNPHEENRETGLNTITGLAIGALFMSAMM